MLVSGQISGRDYTRQMLHSVIGSSRVDMVRAPTKPSPSGHCTVDGFAEGVVVHRMGHWRANN